MSADPGPEGTPAPGLPLPVGKLQPELLARLLAKAPPADRRVLLGPGIGLDCAVIDLGERYLVVKSDPITFAAEQIGWYAVQVNANDLATTGAIPRWLTATLLLPQASTTSGLVESIFDQIYSACASISVSVIGGHTEITHGLRRPILSVTLIGEVEPSRLITPRGARPGDILLLTKGVPIEATAILGRDLADALRARLTATEIHEAAGYLYQPGISVMHEAAAALRAGGVTAMHDPTEGGLAGALWELAQACGHALWVDPGSVPVPPLAERICEFLSINPLAAIASGALLIASRAEAVDRICMEIASEGISCAVIGEVQPGEAQVWQKSGGELTILPRPERDEIARIFD